MNNEWKKEIFAKNLRKYVEWSGLRQKEIAAAIGVSAPTFHDYLVGKKMPRMDRVQKIADYFGILKSDLIEEKSDYALKAAFEAAVLKDSELMDMIKKYMELDDKNKNAIRQMVDALSE